MSVRWVARFSTLPPSALRHALSNRSWFLKIASSETLNQISEPSAEIGLHVLGEVAGEGLAIGHVAGVLGRDDEANMMAVVLAAFGETPWRQQGRCPHQACRPAHYLG